MSDAPTRIKAWGHSGDQRPIRGYLCPGETHYDECDGVEYRRALPDELVDWIKDRMDYWETSPVNHFDYPDYQLLREVRRAIDPEYRDILEAVEKR